MKKKLNQLKEKKLNIKKDEKLNHTLQPILLTRCN